MCGTHVKETPLSFGLKDQHRERREDQRPEEAGSAQLPRQLPLARSWEHPLHDADGVERREDVDELEDGVVRDRMRAEEVCVPRQEDEGVKDLGYEGDAW